MPTKQVDAAIRPATPDDVAGLAAVERAAAALFRGTHMDWAADGPTLPRRLLADGVRRGLLWVAAGQALVGFLVAAPAHGTLYIQELSVVPSYQRRGLGGALVAAVAGHGRAQGYAAVTLTTDCDLPWNRPFYARQGFEMLEGAACPPWLAGRMRTQARHGADPARRCAMRLALG
ncbi:MAG: hypothetical protein BGP12_03415 [Rhodospirillales bacterium 70-18]|nr:MAG: hypothetical protein BGP12_03415 [Rhodospirillales bacterium 70-18]